MTAFASRSVRAAILGGIVCTALACVPTMNALSPAGDYADYRRWKGASMHLSRLSAASSYLARHPKGVFANEVQAWFVPAEQEFFETQGHTIGGARAYLEVLPEGPHVEEATRFVKTWEKEAIEGPAKAKKALEDAKLKAEAARKALGETVENWTMKAVRISAYRVDRATFEKNDTQFAEPYFHDTPEPKCDPDGCSKRHSFTYSAPDAAPPFDRTVSLDVRLETTAGLVVAVTLALPKHGFLYWLEGAEGRPVEVADPAMQTEALMRAKNRIESIVRKHAGDDCTTEEDDDARTLTCGKVRVIVRKGPQGEDLVRIFAL